MVAKKKRKMHAVKHRTKKKAAKKHVQRRHSAAKHIIMPHPASVRGEKKVKHVIRLSTKPANHKPAPEEFLKTGLPGLDQLFEKGFGIPFGSSVLVEGGPGSGKTILCLDMVTELCKQGKKCLYMSFEEPEDRLIEHMELFGWHAQDLIKKDMLRIKRFEAIDVSRSVEALLSAAKKELLIEIDPVLFPHDFKPDIVVIDSLTSIASAFSGHSSRFRIYMEQLFRYLEKNKITTFLIREVATPTHVGANYKEEGEAVSFLSDGIIVIYNIIEADGVRKAGVEVLKMRGSSFKREIVEMEIVAKKGVVIYPNKIVKVNVDGNESRLT